MNASQVDKVVARHEVAEDFLHIKEPLAAVDATTGSGVAVGAPGEQSTEGSNRQKILHRVGDADVTGTLSSVAMPVSSKVFSQSAGESSLSKEVEEPRATKPRSQSECTFTSYEALEDSLKYACNGNMEAEADANGDSTKNGSSKKLSVRTSGSEIDDECPSTMMVHSDESAISDDAQGPPRVITTTSQSISGRSSSSKSKNTLRRGKWTVEEEAYVARVIQDFNSGFLDAPAGTTLRTYLSEKLQCDPMRITKKFTGEACIGKRVFHPAVRSPSNASAIDKAQAELENLERRWRRRLELQQRESAKKAATAVAAGRGLAQDGPFESGGGKGSQRENVVTRTASWLDRANSVLSEQAINVSELEEAGDLQVQMQEVQRLIHEGPIIQQTTAGLPEMIDQAEHEAQVFTKVEPADKRMRTAEDAEALVGFLRSVRASAASGTESF